MMGLPPRSLLGAVVGCVALQILLDHLVWMEGVEAEPGLWEVTDCTPLPAASVSLLGEPHGPLHGFQHDDSGSVPHAQAPDGEEEEHAGSRRELSSRRISFAQ